MSDVRAFALMRIAAGPPVAGSRPVNGREFDVWRSTVRNAVLAHINDFVSARRAVHLDGDGSGAAGDILIDFAAAGKCMRSTFMYLGWLCGAAPNDAALRASASLELLHAFALLQDDVMDDSDQRRGRPAAHIQFAQWHQKRGLSGSAQRFGESAAIVLGDLCMIWAEQMLRESGIEFHLLQQAWPRYDAMRTELAMGQLADLTNDVRDRPPLAAVLDIARRKSGNYTVRRPLEIGAAMAGCADHTTVALGRYGAAIGEAFQLRDDMLGVFGSPEVTGKPSGGDLRQRKATSVAVIAHELADPPTRRQLTALMHSDDLDDHALKRWQDLIVATGAVQCIEDMIRERVAAAKNCLERMSLDGSVASALANMAAACAERAE